MERLRIGSWDPTGRDIASEIFKSTGFRISVRNVEEHKRKFTLFPIESAIPLISGSRIREP